MYFREILVGHIFVHKPSGSVYLKLTDNMGYSFSDNTVYPMVNFYSGNHKDCGKLNVNVKEEVIRTIDVSVG